MCSQGICAAYVGLVDLYDNIADMQIKSHNVNNLLNSFFKQFKDKDVVGRTSKGMHAAILEINGRIEENYKYKVEDLERINDLNGKYIRINNIITSELEKVKKSIADSKKFLRFNKN